MVTNLFSKAVKKNSNNFNKFTCIKADCYFHSVACNVIAIKSFTIISNSIELKLNKNI